MQRWTMPFPSCVNQPLLLSRNQKIHRGLIGGEARLADLHRARGAAICGSVLSRAITYSMAVLETNTSMGLIVAAPTAGSSGIVPGLLLALQEEYSIPDSRVIDALFNAGAIGYLAMRNATVQARWAAARQRWGLPRLWLPRLPWSSWRNCKTVSQCRLVGSHEPAGPGVRPPGRSGGMPLPGQERRWRRCCADRCGAGHERHPPADSF